MKSFSTGLKREASVDASGLREAQFAAQSSAAARPSFERVPVDLGVLAGLVGRRTAWVSNDGARPEDVRAFVAHCEAAGLHHALNPLAHLFGILRQVLTSPRADPHIFRGALALYGLALLPDGGRSGRGWAVYLASPQVAAGHDTQADGMTLADKFKAMLEDGSERFDALFEPLGEPLRHAIRSDCVEAVAAMFEAGVNFEATATHWTPVHEATEANSPRVLEFLVRFTGGVNAIGPGGRSPVHVAAIHGSQQALKVLLADGRVDVNCRCEVGGTALFYACAKQHLEVIEQLVRAGARTDLRLDDGRTPLHLAADTGALAVAVKLLNLGANPTVFTRDRVTPLHTAAVRGDVALVRVLLDAGAEVGSRLSQGLTPVDLAGGHGRHEVLEELFRRGGAPTFRGLCRAVRGDHVEAVRVITRAMLARGENVNAINRLGVTPLHMAAGRGDSRTVAVLLEAGADVNASPQFNLNDFQAGGVAGGYRLRLATRIGPSVAATPLQLAAGNGHADAVDVLLTRGAPVDGTRPPYIASLNWGFRRSRLTGRITLGRCRLRMARPASGMVVSDPLEIAIRRGHESVVRTLIAHGADVARSSRQSGRSMLNLAVEAGREPVLAALLGSGQLTDRAALEEALLFAQASGKAALVTRLAAALEGIPNPAA